MCCVLPVFAEAGSSPLREQFSTSSMLTPAAFYVLHSFDTILFMLIPEITLLRVVDPLQD